MKKKAVLINFYKPDLTPSEVISLKQGVKILNYHDLIILGPEGINLDEFDKYVPGIKRHLVAENLFKGIRNYSRYMLSEGFYSDFIEYESILIYQLDCYVFKDELDYWSNQNYDFIGAPVFENYEKNSNKVFLGVANSGFSLKKPKEILEVLKNWEKLISFKQIIKSNFLKSRKQKFWLLLHKLVGQLTFYYYHKPLTELLHQNSDLILGLFLSKELGLIKTPSPEEAIQFSMEVHPSYLYELNGKKLPFGCHAWEKYDKEFWLKHIRMD